MSLMASTCHHEPWGCSRKPSGLCSLRSLSKHGVLSRPGYIVPSYTARTTFFSQLHTSDHLSNRQYARIVKDWVKAVGLDPAMYGTHTMRRTKASLIYRRTKNLRAVQLLLGHTKLESSVRYLGIEVDDALEMAEQTEV